MGDSFSSGEGASDFDGAQYYRATDNNGIWENPGAGRINDETAKNRFRNACHRSTEAWSRKAVLDTSPGATIGARADSYAADLDFHFIACSGAETEHLLPFYSVGEDKPKNYLGQKGTLGRFRELSQLDQGYVDENTTLVTLSIGGNDALFADILQLCVKNSKPSSCQTQTLEGDAKAVPAATADRINTEMKNSVITVLEQVRMKAPSAKILLVGYPMLFENYDGCALINETEKTWLNDTAKLLNARLKDAAAAVDAASARVIFADPTPVFAGKNLCATPSAINPVVINRSPGDNPMIVPRFPGPDVPLGVSQQSFHPNKMGTTLYAQVMQAALKGVYQ
jgi:lysophospholipase L1-like esterase